MGSNGRRLGTPRSVATEAVRKPQRKCAESVSTEHCKFTMNYCLTAVVTEWRLVATDASA